MIIAAARRKVNKLFHLFSFNVEREIISRKEFTAISPNDNVFLVLGAVLFAKSIIIHLALFSFALTNSLTHLRSPSFDVATLRRREEEARARERGKRGEEKSQIT
jgi:hypothetical protein